MERNYIKNTVILFASMAVTKLVGALFKIPLANLLGGVGMGYFSAAYGLYSPVFAITAAGIPTVMMKLTARQIALNRTSNALKIRSTALILFSLMGLIGTLLVALLSGFFAEHIACSPQSVPCIIAIAPAVMLCCTASVLRGFHEGMSNVIPSAFAAVAEAVSRAIFGLAGAYGVFFYTKTRTEQGLSVFGRFYADYNEAYAAVLPVAAALAVAAVSISELCGLISLLISDRKKRYALPKDNTPTESRKAIAARLIRELLPVAASALVMNCISFVDLVTVPRALQAAAFANSAFFFENYPEILPQCGGIEGIANFMYGSYTGIAVTVFMLIPSFAGMTEKTSLPGIAAAYERKNTAETVSEIRRLLNFSAAIGFPACAGAAVLSRPILTLLYGNRAAEVSVSAVPFGILCTGGFFLIISSALMGIFQVIGKSHIPLILMTISVLLKALINPLLLTIPQINIAGAAISTVISYIFTAATGCFLLKKYLTVPIGIISCLIQPLLSSVLCAGAAAFMYNVLADRINSLFCMVFSVASGAFVYGICLLLNVKIRHLKQKA